MRHDDFDLFHGTDHCRTAAVGAAATFRSVGRERTPQGKAVIARYRDELGDELDDELDAILRRWRSVPDGGDLFVEWRLTRPARQLSRAR